MTRRCAWCGKERRKFSDWEQKTIRPDGKWERLCAPCARRRLDNPWNALIPIRKVGASNE
jgi:hypothetical protein